MASETAVPDTIPELPPAPPRESLIVTAVKFLQNPKVAQSPFSQKKQFLVQKGLTDEEIEIAVSRAGVNAAENNALAIPNQGITMHPINEPVSVWTRIRDFSILAVVVGGVVYGLYTLYKRFIEPIFLRASKAQEEKLEHMEEGVKNIKDELGLNMQELKTTMHELQDQMTAQNMKISQVAANLTSHKVESGYGSVSNSAIGELKAEITSIKGLLLSRNQFPAQPVMKPAIPSWQLKPPVSDPTPTQTQNKDTSDQDKPQENGFENGDGKPDGSHEKETEQMNGFVSDPNDDTQADSTLDS